MASLDRFMEVYAKHLADVRREYPDQYAWPETLLPTVVERMRAAVARGSYNKDGYAFKRTCKEFGIKYTYTAINEFIKG
jgi:hypothetical protein